MFSTRFSIGLLLAIFTVCVVSIVVEIYDALVAENSRTAVTRQPIKSTGGSDGEKNTQVAPTHTI